MPDDIFRYVCVVSILNALIPHETLTIFHVSFKFFSVSLSPQNGWNSATMCIIVMWHVFILLLLLLFHRSDEGVIYNSSHFNTA